MEGSLTISFPDTTTAQANRWAESLLAVLKCADPSHIYERLRADVETQDAGSLLGIVLSSAAVSSLATGLATWIARNSGARVRINLPNGTEVSVSNAAQDVGSIVKAVFEGAYERK